MLTAALPAWLSQSAWLSQFAWPLALLALPLPLLARWLLPRRRSASAALRVPYGAHIDAVAQARGGHALRGRGPGLLVFGQRAYTLTPLTLDLTTVRQQLTDSVVGLAGRETALGDALALAVKRLQSQPADQRVVILLTDGVNTAGVLEPSKAAELARDAHVRVHTIAFGGEGGVSVFGFRLPMPGGGPDDIDEAGLERIASAMPSGNG